MKKIISLILTICITSALCACFSACAPKKEERTHYDLSLVYSDDGSLKGKEKLTFYNSYDNEFSVLKFNLYGNAYREDATIKPVSKTYEASAYYSGASYGKMDIEQVSGCTEWQITGEDKNILSVSLAEPVYPGGKAELEIDFLLTLAKINHRTGIAQNSVNLGNFYPILCAYSPDGFIECPYYSCGDPFVSDVANYTVELEANQKYIVASSGKLVGESAAGENKKWEFGLDGARDFAMVLSPDFKILNEEVNGVKIGYYHLSDETPEATMKAVKESFEYFCSTFGDYVYPTLSVVQTGFCYGGMEYPALTMIAAGQDGEGNIYTAVHENAHQWWYAMVGSDQLCCAWQDEGLAEYSTLLFFESKPSYGYTRKQIVDGATRAYRAYFSVFKQLNGEVDTSMNRNLSTFGGEFEYTNLIYNKGLILFDTLRNSLGDEKFFKCLSGYFEDYCLKTASYEGIVAEFLKSGVNVEGVFESFVQGKILI